MPIPATGLDDELANCPSREVNPRRGRSQPERLPGPGDMGDASFVWRADTAASQEGIRSPILRRGEPSTCGETMTLVPRSEADGPATETSAGEAPSAVASSLDHRRLRDPPRAGPRRHGRRLQGPADRLNRPVALKMIRSAEFATAAELRRFQNEAEAVALLDHPGIVPVYEVGEHDGQRYFSMKLVAGGSLADRLAAYRADPRAAAAAGGRGGRGGAPRPPAGHPPPRPEAGQHPASTTQGHPHVTDFGLAKRVEADAELTAVRRDPGHAGLHGPRAGRGAARRDHDGDRRLRPGRGPLRPADRPGPVRAATAWSRRSTQVAEQPARAAAAGSTRGSRATWR